MNGFQLFLTKYFETLFIGDFERLYGFFFKIRVVSPFRDYFLLFVEIGITHLFKKSLCIEFLVCFFHE